MELINFEIIITASLIRSHPSISFIKQTIESLQHIGYTGDKKIKVLLAHDVNKNNRLIEGRYKKYLDNLKEYCNNYNKSNYKFELCIIIRETHGHLVGNIRNALKYITSKYILIIQHDLPFCRNFKINSILEDMETYPKLKHIRFNKRKNRKVCADGPEYDKINLWNNYNIKGNNNYISTIAWSDNNHLTRTNYYNEFVMKKSKDGGNRYQTMEGYLDIRIKNKSSIDYHYGTYIYGNINEKAYINHVSRCNQGKTTRW